MNHQMNLVVDSGNSAAKVGIFEDDLLVEKSSFSDLGALQSFIQRISFRNLIISTVKADAELIASWGVKAERRFILTKALPLPVNNLYKTPETLGMDRLAGVCGARKLFPAADCLVIDAGTCITYDFLDRGSNYHGGSISPGLMMRFKAVHTFTAKLPLVTPASRADLIGQDTETCIQSGVANGLLAEIDGIISSYREKFPFLNVILCGGDAGFFENQLKASIFASPDLVLIGLNSILIHNVKHS